MALTCSVCQSEHRAEVERGLVRGASQRTVAGQFGLSRQAVGRHVRAGHVPVAIVVDSNREHERHALDLASRVEFLWRRASTILDECSGRPALQLQAVKELRAVVELMARLSGALELQERGETLITLQFPDSRPWPSNEMVEGQVIPAQAIIDTPEGDGA